MKHTRQMGSILDISKQLLLAKYAMSGRHREGPQTWFYFDWASHKCRDVQICLVFHGAATLQ